MPLAFLIKENYARRTHCRLRHLRTKEPKVEKWLRPLIMSFQRWKTADAIKPHPCDSCVQHQTSIGLKHQHSMDVLSRNEESMKFRCWWRQRRKRQPTFKIYRHYVFFKRCKLFIMIRSSKIWSQWIWWNVTLHMEMAFATHFTLIFQFIGWRKVGVWLLVKVHIAD